MIAHNFDSEGNLIKQREQPEEEENHDNEETNNDELVGEEKDNESKDEELTTLINRIIKENNSANFNTSDSSESVEYVFLIEQKSYENKSE